MSESEESIAAAMFATQFVLQIPDFEDQEYVEKRIAQFVGLYRKTFRALQKTEGPENIRIRKGPQP